MGSTEKGSCSGPTQIVNFHGFLFDFDGTIIDSTSAIVKHWQSLGKELGVDPEVILATSHGRRSIDTLQLYDPSKASWEYVSKIEGELPKKYGSDAKEIPGARHTLDTLKKQQAPWCIVTSGTHALVNGWLDVLKLPPPPLLVAAEDVENGKPDPKCYLLGLEKIGLGGQQSSSSAKKVVVVEDAPAGVKAGKAAGCLVLGLGTTHSVESLIQAGADWIIKDLTSLNILETSKGITKVELSNIWTSGS